VSRTSADGAYLANMDGSGEFLKYIANSGINSDIYSGTHLQAGEGLISKVWEKGTAAFVNDLGDGHSDFTWALQTQGSAITLVVDEDIVSVLQIVSELGSRDLAKEIPLFERIVAVAAITVANTLLMESAEKTLVRSRALGAVSRIFRTVDGAAAAWDAVCQALLKAVGVIRATTYILDKTDSDFSRVCWGMENGVVVQYETVPDEILSESNSGWCSRSGESALGEPIHIGAYQPQVHCLDNLVVGVEALIRWENPTRGLVPPGDFIPLAGNMGLINSIGAWRTKLVNSHLSIQFNF